MPRRAPNTTAQIKTPIPNFEELHRSYPYSKAAIDARQKTLESQVAAHEKVDDKGKIPGKDELKDLARGIPDKTKAGFLPEKPYVLPDAAAIVGLGRPALRAHRSPDALPRTGFPRPPARRRVHGRGDAPQEYQVGLVEKFSAAKYVIFNFPRVAEACLALAAITIGVARQRVSAERLRLGTQTQGRPAFSNRHDRSSSMTCFKLSRTAAAVAAFVLVFVSGSVASAQSLADAIPANCVLYFRSDDPVGRFEKIVGSSDVWSNSKKASARTKRTMDKGFKYADKMLEKDEGTLDGWLRSIGSIELALFSFSFDKRRRRLHARRSTSRSRSNRQPRSRCSTRSERC